MTRKRSMFDIDLPEDSQEGPVQPPAPRITTIGERRGPMASAVRETAGSLRERSEAERAIRAENDLLAHEYVRAQKQGLVLTAVPLDAVRTTKLARDRRDVDAAGLEELKASLRDIGLSNPIQVEAAGEDFELVQGLRRLTAYRALWDETGEERWRTIPAMVLAEGEHLERLYRRMVDENLVRTDISFAEMAALARDYAADPGTGAQDLDEAVLTLYRSAAKQKRSYIRAFAAVLEVLGEVLRFPEAIPRALGLSIRRRLQEVPETVAPLVRTLRLAAADTTDEELALLRAYVGEAGQAEAPAAQAAPGDAGKRAPRQARTTFQVEGPVGAAKCTAAQGRLEIRADLDFSTMDRRALEAALAVFLAEVAKAGDSV